MINNNTRIFSVFICVFLFTLPIGSLIPSTSFFQIISSNEQQSTGVTTHTRLRMEDSIVQKVTSDENKNHKDFKVDKLANTTQLTHINENTRKYSHISQSNSTLSGYFEQTTLYINESVVIPSNSSLVLNMTTIRFISNNTEIIGLILEENATLMVFNSTFIAVSSNTTYFVRAQAKSALVMNQTVLRGTTRAIMKDALLQIESNNLSLNNLVIENTTLALSLESLSGVFLNNLTIKSTETGVHLKNVKNSTFSNVYIENSTIGIKVDQSDDLFLVNLTLINLTSIGVEIISGDGLQLENGFFLNTGRSLHFISGSIRQLKDLVLQNSPITFEPSFWTQKVILGYFSFQNITLNGFPVVLFFHEPSLHLTDRNFGQIINIDSDYTEIFSSTIYGPSYIISSSFVKFRHNKFIDRGRLITYLSHGIEVKENQFAGLNSTSIEIIYGNNPTIVKNQFSSGTRGIFIKGINLQNRTRGGNISLNVFSNFSDSAIVLLYTAEVFLINNFFRNNELALRFDNSIKYVVYLNVFEKNQNDVEILGGTYTGGAFDYKGIGNWWDRYKGNDVDGDGIGEIPHTLSYTQNDRYPLIYGISQPPIMKNLTLTPLSPTNIDVLTVEGFIADQAGILRAEIILDYQNLGRRTTLQLHYARFPAYYRTSFGPFPGGTQFKVLVRATDGHGNVRTVELTTINIRNTPFVKITIVDSTFLFTVLIIVSSFGFLYVLQRLFYQIKKT